MSAGTFTVTIENRKMVPIETDHGTGHTSVPDGKESWTVEVTADLEALARRLGPRAIRSKGKKAVDAHGAVVIRAVRCISTEPAKDGAA